MYVCLYGVCVCGAMAVGTHGDAVCVCVLLLCVCVCVHVWCVSVCGTYALPNSTQMGSFTCT